MGNSSYINVIAFVIITILYYFLKPTLTLKRDEAQKYKETRYVYLSIYLMIIILTQFFVNVSIIKSTCGGNIRENIGPAALFTFMPWLFIFGIMVVVLLLYPGFKSVFADVIGYFYISSAANEIITTLLINKDVEDAMDKGGEPTTSVPSEKFDTSNEVNPDDGSANVTAKYDDAVKAQTADDNRNNPSEVTPPEQTNFLNKPDSALPQANPAPMDVATPILSDNYDSSILGPSVAPSAPTLNDITPKSGGKKEKRNLKMRGGGPKELQDAAEIIVKICGNMSVLINQITPENFTGYWKILTPLMKPKYQSEDNTVETDKLKNDLFQLVVTRDNVGESMWYIYAGILVTSIVQLKIATRGCVKSTTQMEKDYQSFLDEEAVAKANKDKQEETTYTL